MSACAKSRGLMTDVAIGRVDEIPPGEGRTYAVDGEQIAVYRLRDGSLRALGAVCPHRGGPLADGLDRRRRGGVPTARAGFDLATGAEIGAAGRGSARTRWSPTATDRSA